MLKFKKEEVKMINSQRSKNNNAKKENIKEGFEIKSDDDTQ